MMKINLKSFLLHRYEELLFKEMSDNFGVNLNILHDRKKMIENLYEMMFNLKYNVAFVLYYPHEDINMMILCWRTHNKVLLLFRVLQRIGESHKKIVRFVTKYLPKSIWPHSVVMNIK